MVVEFRLPSFTHYLNHPQNSTTQKIIIAQTDIESSKVLHNSLCIGIFGDLLYGSFEYHPKWDLGGCGCLFGDKNIAPILYVQPDLPPDKDRQMGIRNVRIDFSLPGLLLRGGYCASDTNREHYPGRAI